VPSTPSELTDTLVVVPVDTSCTKASVSSLVSPVTRFVASEAKATDVPWADTCASELGPFASTPPLRTDTRRNPRDEIPQEDVASPVRLPLDHLRRRRVEHKEAAVGGQITMPAHNRLAVPIPRTAGVNQRCSSLRSAGTSRRGSVVEHEVGLRRS
jgi:hypothetical protein